MGLSSWSLLRVAKDELATAKHLVLCGFDGLCDEEIKDTTTVIAYYISLSAYNTIQYLVEKKSGTGASFSDIASGVEEAKKLEVSVPELIVENADKIESWSRDFKGLLGDYIGVSDTELVFEVGKAVEEWHSELFVQGIR